MKGLIFAGLSAFLMSTSAIAAPQPSFATNAVVRSNETSAVEISPNALANLAYQGHFRSQGIPGYSGLLNAHASGRVGARDVIQAAINAGRLPAETLSNSNYVQNVEYKLASLNKG
jgi:hypothetical protein